QRQCAGSLGDRTQVALADALRRELALHEMQAADHADNGFSAGHLCLSPGSPSRNWQYHWRTELRRLALAELIRCLLGLSAFGCGPDTRGYRRDEGGTRGITSTYPRGNANSSPIERKQHETTTILDAIEGLPRQTHLHRLAFVRNAVVVKISSSRWCVRPPDRIYENDGVRRNNSLSSGGKRHVGAKQNGRQGDNRNET